MKGWIWSYQVVLSGQETQYRIRQVTGHTRREIKQGTRLNCATKLGEILNYTRYISVEVYQTYLTKVKRQ